MIIANLDKNNKINIIKQLKVNKKDYSRLKYRYSKKMNVFN